MFIMVNGAAGSSNSAQVTITNATANHNAGGASCAVPFLRVVHR
jgi:hypothetical protein